MKKLFILLIFISGVKASSFAQQEAVTNQTIIELHKAQLGSEIIISKINTSKCVFNLTVESLLELKKAGIPNDIINAMMLKQGGSNNDARSAATHYDHLSPGIYVLDTVTGNTSEIEPAIITNSRSGGFGESIGTSLLGPLNAKTRASLDGRQSKQKVSTSMPVFIFVFDTSVKAFNSYEHNTNIFGMSGPTNVQSPNEFILLHLKVIKNSREFVTGKQSTVASNTGIDNRAKMEFSFKKLKNGIYRVMVGNPLPAGEYGFIIAKAASAISLYDPVLNQKVYDFSIQ